MDIATVGGLLFGFALLGTAIVLGGDAAAFVDAPAVLIVVGGTFAMTVMSYSLGDVLRAQGAIRMAVVSPRMTPSAAATFVLELAELARGKGPLALENVQADLAPQPFLRDGIQMVIDGTAGDEVEKVLSGKSRSLSRRHAISVGVFRKAAEVAPAMGLIGTLVGLVQMLGNLDDPATIGPGMAVALLTTFYGAILSNMVFAPLAAKIERNAREEALLHEIYLTGTTSIGRRENPRRLEMLLNARLPPSEQVNYFN